MRHSEGVVEDRCLRLDSNNMIYVLCRDKTSNTSSVKSQIRVRSYDLFIKVNQLGTGHDKGLTITKRKGGRIRQQGRTRPR